ncbi:hypothetical protein ATY76_18115 [Rhizobium sp. R339]|uniref:hypothetical protein n=1 Tax=Rhizobium sp. R339 TaxID=1764273 RepID=UPI000B52D249|nr:hypothetical protein [Rhizobium sp. R339]OWV66418.1 hypothetical protein ATY76_18115 [Rhizobium sp. R339]
MTLEEKGHSLASQDRAGVRAQLDRILASAEFHVPERGRHFLEYIVEETLEGRSEQLKAYTIAQAVFGRDASFDAQNDPVVRIEAGRIRRALERYYLVCGSRDPIRITVPKGGYSPHFSSAEGVSDADETAAPPSGGNKRSNSDQLVGYRDLLLPIGVPALFGTMAILALIRPLEAYLSPPETSPAAVPSTLRSKTGIMVEPFTVLGDNAQGMKFASGLADQLIAKLMKVDDFVVFAPGRSGPETSGSLLSLQGSALVEGTVLHLHVRLINGADGTVVWANRYERELRNQAILDVENEIAEQIVKEIGNGRKPSGAATVP